MPSCPVAIEAAIEQFPKKIETALRQCMTLSGRKNNSSLRLRETVVLVGLMGAGKTQVGRRLGLRLGVPFFDSDEEVEAAAGMSVSDIFSVHGEEAFRDAERKVIHRLITGPTCIVATGGGAYMSEATRLAIASHARSLWLRATLDVLHSRTSRSRRRPLLLNTDARQVLADLMDKRYPVYAEAEIVLESDDRSADQTALRVIGKLTELGIVDE